jgi:hypothetical protein
MTKKVNKIKINKVKSPERNGYTMVGIPDFSSRDNLGDKVHASYRANRYIEKNIQLEALERELRSYRRWYWLTLFAFVANVISFVIVINN